MTEEDAFLGSVVVDMYAKYGFIPRAWEVFDELWNVLMQGFRSKLTSQLRMLVTLDHDGKGRFLQQYSC